MVAIDLLASHRSACDYRERTCLHHPVCSWKGNSTLAFVQHLCQTHKAQVVTSGDPIKIELKQESYFWLFHLRATRDVLCFSVNSLNDLFIGTLDGNITDIHFEIVALPPYDYTAHGTVHVVLSYNLEVSRDAHWIPLPMNEQAKLAPCTLRVSECAVTSVKRPLE
jgi:hypothetical protein